MKVRILAICFILLAPPTLADPGPVGNYLINTPASQFSIGLLRLQLSLEKLSADDQDSAYFWSEYNWAENRIAISAFALGTMEFSNASCRDLINKVRSDAGVNTETGEIKDYRRLLYGDWTEYSDLFGPVGYERTDAPENWQSRLDQIFVVFGTVYQNADFSGSAITCQGRLVSSEILVDVTNQSDAPARAPE